MKTKILLSLGIVFSLLFSAQAEEVTVERLDSITYTNNAGDEVKKEKMLYTEDGLITSHITYNIATGDTTTLTYTYNELGQLTEKITSAPFTNPFTGATVINERKEEYTYDENGVLNQTTVSSKEGDEWQNSDRTSAVTNNRGLLEVEEQYIWYGFMGWYLNEKKEYAYDSENRVISVDIYMGSEEVTDGEIYVYTEEDGKTTRIGTGGSYIDPETYEPSETLIESWKDKQITNENGDVVSYEKLSYTESYNFVTWEIESGWAGEKYTVTKTGNTVTTNEYIWDSEKEEWSLNASTEDMPITSMWNPTAPPTARWITEYIKNPAYDENDPGAGEYLIGSIRTIYGLSGNIVTSKSKSVLTSIGGSIGWSQVEEEIYTVDESITLDQIHVPATLAGAPYFFTHKPTAVVKHTFADGDHTTDHVAYHYTSPKESGISTTKAANDNINVYFVDNTLSIDTPNAEAVSVYSVNGKLLFSANKAEGKADFAIALAQGAYIVKGTGWTAKVVK